MRRNARTLVLLLALLTSACGRDDGGRAGRQGQAAGQPDLNAEIRIAANEDQWTVNGVGAKATHFMFISNFNVYEPLIYLASDYTLKPGLAERWELQPDRTTWRFFLRRGVTFHDGSAFTADDVVWTWGTRQAEGKTLPTVANTLHPTNSNTPSPEAVRKIDDFTVDFTPIQPNLRLPEQIVHPQGAIVKRNTHNDTPPYAGTGPFKYVSYVEKQTAVFERNDNYWGDKPKVNRLNIRFYTDPQTRLQALRAGQADLAIDLPPEAVKALASDNRFRVVKSKPGRNHLIFVNKTAGRITEEKAVREAVNLALNRQAYVDVVLEGNGEPGRWMAPASVLGPAANQVAAVPHDPGKARSVLDAAGWRVGSDGVRVKGDKRLTLTLLGQPEVAESALLVIQSNLKDVGMDLALKKTPDVATRNALYLQGRGDFDLVLEVPNQNDANPAFLPVVRMYSKNANTAAFAPGPAFDALAEQSLAAQTTAEAQLASAKMMTILINDEHIVVPLAAARRIYAMATNVSFTDPHPSFPNQTWFSLSMTHPKP